MNNLYMCLSCEAHDMKPVYAMGHSEREGHRIMIQTPEALFERSKPTKSELVARGESKLIGFIIDKDTPSARCVEPCEHIMCRRMFEQEWLAREIPGTEEDNV
jgi:hypothetical protein